MEKLEHQEKQKLSSLYGQTANQRLNTHDIAIILMALQYLVWEDEKFLKEWSKIEGVEPMIIRTTQEIEEIRELKAKICHIDW